mmetsp:Transcript_35461/g.72373  ORF Transcript_35461/g.72373 Transcript_35461/m.72373 type:complete len:301 (+) Transcript_35461:84-986(+)
MVGTTPVLMTSGPVVLPCREAYGAVIELARGWRGCGAAQPCAGAAVRLLRLVPRHGVPFTCGPSCRSNRGHLQATCLVLGATPLSLRRQPMHWIIRCREFTVGLRWDLHLAADAHVFAAEILLLLRPATRHAHVAVEGHCEGNHPIRCSGNGRHPLQPLFEVGHRDHDPGGRHLSGARGGTSHAHVFTAPNLVRIGPELDDLGPRWWQATGGRVAVVTCTLIGSYLLVMLYSKDDGRSDEAQKETSAAGPQAPPVPGHSDALPVIVSSTLSYMDVVVHSCVGALSRSDILLIDLPPAIIQ